MDLSTEEGIRNFRKALHMALEKNVSDIDLRKFQKNGHTDYKTAMMSITDKLGLDVLYLMKSQTNKPVINQKNNVVQQHMPQTTVPALNDSTSSRYMQLIMDDSGDL